MIFKPDCMMKNSDSQVFIFGEYIPQSLKLQTFQEANLLKGTLNTFLSVPPSKMGFKY